MANITERPNKDGTKSYLIRVFVSQDRNDKQHPATMTYRSEPGMTEKQAQKEAERQAVLFEEKVKQGLVAMGGGTTFEVYAEKWLETQNTIS